MNRRDGAREQYAQIAESFASQGLTNSRTTCIRPSFWSPQPPGAGCKKDRLFGFSDQPGHPATTRSLWLHGLSFPATLNLPSIHAKTASFGTKRDRIVVSQWNITLRWRTQRREATTRLLTPWSLGPTLNSSPQLP